MCGCLNPTDPQPTLVPTVETTGNVFDKCEYQIICAETSVVFY